MLNKVTLIGNLGKSPETRYTQSGTAVTSFSVATTETWKDVKGDRQEHTEWHKIVAFGRLGEICGEYLDKGSKIYLEGKIQTRKWDDKEGNTRYSTEIVASNMKMLSPRPGGDYQPGVPPAEHGDAPMPPVPPPPVMDGMGDDVPF